MRAWRRGIAILAGAAVGCSLGATSPVIALATTIVEYPVAGSGPNGIVTGTDGALWFTDAGNNAIDRMTPDGQVTNYYSIPTSNSTPTEITRPTADGSMWFLEMNGLTVNIGNVTLAGAVTEYSSGSGYTSGITVGPDGNIWFGDVDHFSVARMDATTHAVTDYPIPPGTLANPNRGAKPVEITSGPDGNLWVTDEPENTVWKVTTSGNFTPYQIPGTHRGFVDITVGADNNLWIVEGSQNAIARMTTSGYMTEFAIPTASSAAVWIAPGPDGNVWFTEVNANQVGVITPAGDIAEFPIPTANSLPRRPTAGPDNHVWFPENVGKIAKVLVGRQTPTWWNNPPLTTNVPKPNGPWYRRATAASPHVVGTATPNTLPQRVPTQPFSESRQTLSSVGSAVANLGEEIAARLRAILS